MFLSIYNFAFHFVSHYNSLYLPPHIVFTTYYISLQLAFHFTSVYYCYIPCYDMGLTLCSSSFHHIAFTTSYHIGLFHMISHIAFTTSHHFVSHDYPLYIASFATTWLSYHFPYYIYNSLPFPLLHYLATFKLFHNYCGLSIRVKFRSMFKGSDGSDTS
jgi:hypothetical protein